MGYYPPIPIQFRISGDYNLGVEFVDEGRRLAWKLRIAMNRGGLPNGYGEPIEDSLDIGRLGPKKYTGDYGTVYIEVFSTHGLTYVYINARPRMGYVEEVERPTCSKLFPCFILAKIEKVSCYDSDISIGYPCTPSVKLRTDGRFWYDVSYYKEDEFILLENYVITSAGWEVYEKGQYVLLGPSAVYNSYPKTWNCCADKEPLANEVTDPGSNKMFYLYLDVYPVSILGCMP